MTIPHSIYEMNAQGITVVDAFLKDIGSMMNTTSIIPCAQVLWGEWPIMSSTNTHLYPHLEQHPIVTLFLMRKKTAF